MDEYDVVTSEEVKNCILATNAEAASPESDSLKILDTLCHLPNELTNLKMLQDQSEDFFFFLKGKELSRN